MKMSTTVKVSLPRTRVSKIAVHERRNTAKRADNCVPKGREVLKKKILHIENTKVNVLNVDTETMDTESEKHDLGQDRLQHHDNSNETDRNHELLEKKLQSKSSTDKQQILRNNNAPDIVSVKDSVSSDSRTKGGGIKRKVKDDRVRSEATTNKDCKIKHMDIPTLSILSKTLDVGIPEKPTKKKRLPQDISLNISSHSGALISDGYVPNETGLILSDTSEDTIEKPDKPDSVYISDQGLSVSGQKSEQGHKISKDTSKTQISQSSGDETRKTKTSDTKNSRSVVPKSIPNYLKNTSSSANKDVRKNTSIAQNANSRPLQTTQDRKSGLRFRDNSEKKSFNIVKTEKCSKSESRSSPDEKTVISKTSSNTSEIISATNKNNINADSDPRSNCLSPNDSIQRGTSSLTTQNESPPLNCSEEIALENELSKSGSKDDRDEVPESNSKPQKSDDLSKAANQRKSKSQVPPSHSHTLFPKPLKLSVRKENHTKSHDSNSSALISADSKVFSPRLKRKESPAEVDKAATLKPKSSKLKTTSLSTGSERVTKTAPADTIKEFKPEKPQKGNTLKKEPISRSRSATPGDCPSSTNSERSRSSTPGACLTSSSSNNSTKSISQHTMISSKDVMPKASQSIIRDSNRRPRSITPSALSVPTSIDSSTKHNSQRKISNTKLLNSKPVKKVTKDTVSTFTMKVSSTSTSGKNSNQGNLDRTAVNSKQEHSKQNLKTRRNSNSRSRSTTPASLSMSSSSENSTKMLDSEQEHSKPVQTSDRDLNSRSRSTTPGSSSSSSSFCKDISDKRSSKHVVSSLKQEIPKVTRKVVKGSNLQQQSTNKGTILISSNTRNKAAQKPSSVVKRPTFQTQKTTSRTKVPSTSHVPTVSVASYNQRVKLAAKQMALKSNGFQENQKYDRDSKSRSRSSTPGVTSVPASTSKDDSHPPAAGSLKQTSPTVYKVTTTTETQLSIKTKELSAFGANDINQISESSTTQTQQSEKEGSKSVNLLATSNLSVSTKPKNKEISKVIIEKKVPALKRKSVSHVQHSTQKRQLSKITFNDPSCRETEEQHKLSDIPVPVQAKSTSAKYGVVNKQSESGKVPSSVTRLVSPQKNFKSCNSLPAADINTSTKGECKLLHLSESQSICNMKASVLSSGKSDKLIMKSTKLSIKTDSRQNAGKMSTSERNKSLDSMQNSSENRNYIQTGSRNSLKKANKTFVSDNKSSKTALQSVSKRDSVSTNSCNKSVKVESSKQKSQLTENRKVCSVNTNYETECLDSNDKLHNVSFNSCLFKRNNELINSSESGNLTGGKMAIKDFDFKSHIKTDETCDLNTVKMDEINYQTRTQLGSNTRSGILKSGFCSTENVCYEKNEQEKHAECVLKESNSPTFSNTNTNLTDHGINARDLNAKGNSNCLSDVRENETQHVNEEICSEITCVKIAIMQSENGVCSQRTRPVSPSDSVDFLQNKGDNELLESDMYCEKTCIGRKKQSESLRQKQKEKNIILCNTCKENRVNLNNVDNAKNTCGRNKCINCHKSLLIDKTEFTSKENRSSLGDSISTDSQDFKCQNDKHTETQTFEMYPCDVNRSDRVPITQECALKHIEFTDSQIDKTKCTDVVPVTGAASLQIENKRQDKKISSLSNCGLRNSVLLRKRNGFVLKVDGHVGSDGSSGDRNTTCHQTDKDMEAGQNCSDIISSHDTGEHDSFEIRETKMAENDSKCYDVSSAIKRTLSDWQNTGLCDRICSENMAEIQVVNKDEMNKETSDPKQDCRKLNGDDISSCGNSEKTQEVNYKEASTAEVGRLHVTCDMFFDTGSENLGKNIREKQAALEPNVQDSEYTMQEGFTGVELNVQDSEYTMQEGFTGVELNVHNKIPFEGNDNKKYKSNDNVHCDSETLIEESETLLQNTLVCDSHDFSNDSNIGYQGDETNLPARNLRTKDAKLINTDHDLSFNSACTGVDISKNTNAPGHSGQCSHSEKCKREQYQCYNDRSVEIVSNSAENDMNGTLPNESFLQNQLKTFKPDGVLSESKHQSDTTDTPCVLDAQEKQSQCLNFANDSKGLFSQQIITENGLTMTHCDRVGKLHEFHEPATFDRERGYLQNKGNSLLVKQKISSESEINVYTPGMQIPAYRDVFHNRNNNLFSNVPKLTECIYKMYPKLNCKNAVCKINFEEKIKPEKLQCSNMTQAANVNEYSLNMRLNDSACLFQHYKQRGIDDIKVSPECVYCAELSQTSEGISNGGSNKLHSQYDLNKVNCREPRSLKNVENNLCTGSTPCDRNKIEISAHINRKTSFDYHELNDLSRLFDDGEDTESCGKMSRDNARATIGTTELSSELSAHLTDCETLKICNRTTYQDGFEDKPPNLSTVKITTQKSSCNLMFSEKSSEPKDFVLRYEHKNSAGHKKFYSCKDEPDSGITSTQDENNFRNLAANRDGDINYEIKLNNLNIETPPHCDASSQDTENSSAKIPLDIQGQDIQTGQEFSSTFESKHFESKGSLNKFSKFEEHESCELHLHLDSVRKGNNLTPVEAFLNGDNRVSSKIPDPGSDKNNQDNRNIETGVLQEYSTGDYSLEDLDSKLPFNKEESSKVICPKTIILEENFISDDKKEYQSHISDNLQNKTDEAYFSGQKTVSDFNKESDVTTTKPKFVAIEPIESNHSRLERKTEHDNSISLPEIVENSGVFDTTESGTQSRNSLCSPLDETLSDTSEAFTDAEDRVISPYLDTSNIKCKDFSISGKVSSISCRESTSTESFVDAVESLDDDYLTTVKFRHSKEIKDEENLSPTSPCSDDSSTSVVGSMEDSSGWEEFSENITDLNDFDGEMETRRYDVTNNVRNNLCIIPDGQTQASVAVTDRVFHDKRYLSSSPSLESNEIYLSEITTNILKYKDKRHDAEQKVIEGSIFETGNGGISLEINDQGVRGETGIGSNTKLQNDATIGYNNQHVALLFDDNSRHTASSEVIKNTDIKSSENTKDISVVGSKIETAVMKRTQRRRRRQIEQLRVHTSIYPENCATEDNKTFSDIDRRIQVQAYSSENNDSIEKNMSSHSEHSEYACVISDNMTFNNKPESGTQVLSDQVNRNLNLNEFNSGSKTFIETPLNYDYEDCDTTAVSVGIDKTCKTEFTFSSSQKERIPDTEKQIEEHKTCVNKNDNLEILTTRNNFVAKSGVSEKCELDTCVEIPLDKVQKDKAKQEEDDGLQIGVQKHGHKTDVDFDDIQYIDADEISNDVLQYENCNEGSQKYDSLTQTNQDKPISPNVSFTFSFEEHCRCRNENKNLFDKAQSNMLKRVDSRDEQKINVTENTDDHVLMRPEQVDSTDESLCKDVDVNHKIIPEDSDNTEMSEGDKIDQEACNIMEEMRKLQSLDATSSSDILLEKQLDSPEGAISADICEESNISVKLALEIEKQKLACCGETRSRKSLFISRRNERRATIDNGSFEDKDKRNESANDSELSAATAETTTRNSVKKSQSFRLDRKQISPMASFMNPPEVACENESSEIVSKKVSDICKTFMTKTRASSQKTRTQSTSKSPAPQRKLMKWVNNQGKWMRVPVDQLEEKSNERNLLQNEDLISPKIENKTTHTTHETIVKSSMQQSPVKGSTKQESSEYANSSLQVDLQIPGSDFDTATSEIKTEILDRDSILKPVSLQTDTSKGAGDVCDTTLDSKLTKSATENDVSYGPDCYQKPNLVNDVTSITVGESSTESTEIHIENETKQSLVNEIEDSECMHKKYRQKEPVCSETTVLDVGDNSIAQNKKEIKVDKSTEPRTNESDSELEVKVIVTTLNDAQCDKEKHRKRQELLFGLLDSYNRRKPRRFTQPESIRNIQISSQPVTDIQDKSSVKCDNVETCTDKVASSENQESISEIPKGVPKLKAVKIQEEVFECKKEYLKDTNIISSSNLDSLYSEPSSADSKNIKDNAISGRPVKYTIKKSKTFSGLGDVERLKHFAHAYISDNEQTDTKSKQYVTVDGGNNVNTRNHEEESGGVNEGVSITSKIVDKRARADLKLDLEKTQTKKTNSFYSDKPASRLETDRSRERSQNGISPNRLCVDQPRIRVRSPDKGPRQILRSKLLSEIVEVEENKEDNSVTCERRQQQQQQQYRDRQQQEVQKPVKRSNKRRSLSLPTGTLAFGEARIVYKNGHFTIETMDSTEYETNHLSECHSSSDHLASQEDDLWDTPDSRVKSHLRETIEVQNKPLMKRQHAKTALKSSDSTEDVFYNNTDYRENVDLHRSSLNGESRVLNMGQTDEEVFNESCSSRTSDMSIDSYSSERMDVSTDESASDPKKLSSSSLPESKDEEVKLVMQRAKRTSSFRAAQKAGALRLSGIEEDIVHNSTRARAVSLDESQNSDLNKSPKVQSVQNQNPTFLKKVMAKRKNANENISGFSKQSESAKEFFSKKMTLKGLFRKNKSDTSVSSPVKTEHPVSPPIATFQGDDIGSVDTPPSSPYRARDLRRRHTSADILKTYPDSSETDSNCPTPTQERSSSLSRNSISTPSTPSHDSSVFTNLSSHTAPSFRDEDEMSITSASSLSSSIHSPPFEQPHKPKTPKPVGASPRRNPSICSQLSRSGSQSSQRNVLNSVTSLESDQYEMLQDDLRDQRCECNIETLYRMHKTPNRNVRGSADSLTMCQFCKQREFYKSDSAFSNSPFHKQQMSSREQLSEDSAKLRRDSRSSYDRLGIISQTDVASSNSNDSGIQRDSSLHSSNESIKGTPESRVRLRRNKSLSPHPDRPKSEISVKWADGDSGDYDIIESPVKLRHKNLRDRPRPKSDLDGSTFLSGRMKAFGSEVNLQPYCSLRSLYEIRRHDQDRQKNRRMSTPHPIKSRLQRAPQKLQKQPPLVRSSSMPESLEKIHKRRKMHHLLDFHLDSLSRHMDIDDMSDDSDLSFDQASLQERSVSVQSSSSQLTAMDEDEDNLTYAEALWDHITMDPEELGFRAQDVIEVLDMADKDWWFGVIDDREGWFPATFVRIRVNQDQLDDDLDLDATIQDNLTTSPKLRRISMFNKNQARSNVVNEIIHAEREYVKHLKDVVEGYIQHARKRTEMFPQERILLIFGNIETIYGFAKKFLSQLEMCIDVCPHLSEIGQCFLDNERGFEIYSDYCNNHPSACEELDELCRDSKYKHFFEACRLLQELVEIPLEGFLLTPVQKICKYPLQLAELLKYTPPDHPDYMMVKDALAAMRKIATLINERKRKMESIEKIAAWQHSVVDWEGPDLLERSSELIFSGELNKINTAGWSQERFFFLFDHQLVYCKKELLKRHVFNYKGRIDLDHCDIVDVPDGKDSQYNVTVKHAWKFHETHKDKWYLVYAKSEAVKQSWLKAIKGERQRVLEDQENDFCVPDHWKQTVLNKVRSQSHIKDKQSGGRSSHGQLKDLKDFTYATLPRHRTSQKHDKKKGWFKFGGGKKSKR